MSNSILQFCFLNVKSSVALSWVLDVDTYLSSAIHRIDKFRPFFGVNVHYFAFFWKLSSPTFLLRNCTPPWSVSCSTQPVWSIFPQQFRLPSSAYCWLLFFNGVFSTVSTFTWSFWLCILNYLFRMLQINPGRSLYWSYKVRSGLLWKDAQRF